MGALKRLARRILPLRLRRGAARLAQWPPVGGVRLGQLRRLAPVDREWGSARGTPIDRYFIEGFLKRHATDIRGRVLEIGTDAYTRRFGGDRVERADVLHVSERSPGVTIVGDLTRADQVPEGTFDCILLTQTLQFIYDPRAALESCHRALRPGGILLATVPGISQISRHDMDRWGDFWRFTTLSAERLFGEVFPSGGLEVLAHGNVLASVAFLHGLAMEELEPAELDHLDPDYQLLITVRARKAGEAG
jgi:SAM-dependent methyltransferase